MKIRFSLADLIAYSAIIWLMCWMMWCGWSWALVDDTPTTAPIIQQTTRP